MTTQIDGTLRDDLVDDLCDLKHDLGKYLRLPLAMLPEGAGDEEVRQALFVALKETRRGRQGVQSAAELWGEFSGAWGEILACYGAFASLSQAVVSALALEEKLEPESRLPPRSELIAVLSAVATRIAEVIEEVQSE